MLDSQCDAAKAIQDTIKDGTKVYFEVLMDEISEYADTEECEKRIMETKD